jgi:hypothetical protein
MRKTMTIRSVAINLYLPLACALALFFGLGCETTEKETKKKKDKEAAVIELHLEVNADGTERNAGVPIYRENPIKVNVVREPFIDTADVQEASVVETIGGFAIRVLFNRHGTLVLDNVTTAYKGQRIGVYSRWTESRWLAAPLIKARIQTGEFIFTPDASREEAERIVKGLNNIAKDLQKK